VTRFILKRALDSTVALLGLLIVVFFLTRMTGDPASLYLPENATEQDRIEFAIRHGYADPIPIQFGRYVLGLLQFDFGQSITQQRPAMEAVLEAAPTTAKLATVSMLVTIALSVLIGCLAASKPNGIFDRLATTVSLGGASAPDFWIAIVGILVFAVYFRLLPTSGSGSIEYWIMPVFIVALRPVALLTQVVRGAMISALAAPYVKTARAKGLSKQKIIFQHALRSSLLPTITVAGDLFVGMINGSIIAETVFGLRGLGKVLIDAIFQRDFAVVQSAVLFVAVAIFVLNIIIDIVYALVDPRIRYS
jgi:peptide/nickel transport system permease protein